MTFIEMNILKVWVFFVSFTYTVRNFHPFYSLFLILSSKLSQDLAAS